MFVSSCNAYPGWPEAVVDEDTPTWDGGPDEYGPNKAACERAAEAALPGRVATVRAGLIVGPHDGVFRLPWWVQADRAGGGCRRPAIPRARSRSSTRATSPPGCSTSRSGGWRARSTAPRRAGRRRWASCSGRRWRRRARTRRWPGSRTPRCGAPSVEPWTELPLWLPADEFPGTWQVGTARAQAAGLRCRPVAETVADVWAWLRDGGEAEVTDWGSHARPAPMRAERERELLALAA